MAGITQVTAFRPVSALYHKRTVSVISGSRRRILLRQRVHRICSVLSRIMGIAGETSVIISKQIIHISLCPAAVIQMQKKSEIIHLHLISRMPCLQGKNFIINSIINRHKHCPPFRFFSMIRLNSDALQNRIFIEYKFSADHIENHNLFRCGWQ